MIGGWLELLTKVVGMVVLFSGGREEVGGSVEIVAMELVEGVREGSSIVGGLRICKVTVIRPRDVNFNAFPTRLIRI